MVTSTSKKRKVSKKIKLKPSKKKQASKISRKKSLEKKPEFKEPIKITNYKKTHKLLKLSDFKNLPSGQPVRIAIINNGDEKIEKFTFKFINVTVPATSQKKWFSHYINGSSKYTMGLPLVVLKNGKIRYTQSSDYSDAYLDSPIIITKSIQKKTIRPSPSDSAKLFKVGAKKLGNDGNTWIITETNTGVKRWKKLN